MNSDKIIEEFDQWVDDGRGDSLEEGHGDVARQVIERMEIGSGEKVLDLGCGTGWATRLLAKTAAGVQAIGIDVSPRMIERAEELHSLTIRARYDLGCFEELTFRDGEFDRIFSVEALYYALDLDAALSEAFRVLRPGGSADILIDFRKENPATECWIEYTGLPMHWLGEQEWVERMRACGFTSIETSRVIDSRGPGEESSFTPSDAFPDWATRMSVHEAGTLWIHAKKPE